MTVHALFESLVILSDVGTSTKLTPGASLRIVVAYCSHLLDPLEFRLDLEFRQLPSLANPKKELYTWIVVHSSSEFFKLKHHGS